MTSKAQWREQHHIQGVVCPCSAVFSSTMSTEKSSICCIMAAWGGSSCHFHIAEPERGGGETPIEDGCSGEGMIAVMTLLEDGN
jgi:hypothetical protein